MSTDWPYSDDQRDFQQTLARIQPALPEPDASGDFPRDRWRAVAAAGALGMSADDVGASALDLVAVGEGLGLGGCPGPWWQTLLAVPALAAPEADTDVDAVLAGDLIVSVGTADYLPWGRAAGKVFELGAYDADGWRLRPVQVGQVGDSWLSLGQEPVLSAELVACGQEVLVPPRPALLARLGLAAYLSGAGRRALGDVVGYVTQRTQFRSRIGDFAAVAHPLADCDARVRAAAALARRAAVLIDACADRPGNAEARAAHTALRASARAAREAVYQAHQSYGAIGFSEEGPLAWLGQRVAQLATEAEWLARDVSLLPQD